MFILSVKIQCRTLNYILDLLLFLVVTLLSELNLYVQVLRFTQKPFNVEVSKSTIKGEVWLVSKIIEWRHGNFI